MTQVRDRRPPSPRTVPPLSAYGAKKEKSDKGQGFGCDKEGPDVLPWLSTARGHPGARS